MKNIERSMIMKQSLRLGIMILTAIFLSSCGASKPKVVTTKTEKTTKVGIVTFFIEKLWIALL